MPFNVQTHRFTERPREFVGRYDEGVPADQRMLGEGRPMCHHRIPWSLLRESVLNRVLAGRADAKIWNLFMAFSNDPSKPHQKLVDAVKQIQANNGRADKALLKPEWIASLEALESEVFSLPVNLFHGPTERGDDPGDSIDFTPADVDAQGQPLSELERCYEAIFGLLSAESLAVEALEAALSTLQQLTMVGGRRVYRHTPQNLADWFLPAGRAVSAYRRHRKADGTFLTVAESADLNSLVAERARKRR